MTKLTALKAAELPPHTQAEDYARLIVESVKDYAIFMLDPQGRVQTWNPGAERIKGYAADEIIGHHFSRFYTAEDLAAGTPARLIRTAQTEGRVEEEGWRLRKDGTRFWASAMLTAVRGPDGTLIGFAKVTRDLTERRRAEEEKLRLTQAQEAIRLRDEFLSIASHELRTPLTALQLQLQSMVEFLPEAGGKLATKLERAMRGATRLDQLIENLLDVSRISAGRFDLQRAEMDLSALVTDILERQRATAARAGCALVERLEPGLVGWWDTLRLEQVVSNLITNAVKYAAGQPIEVALTRDGAEVVLEVTDHGPGIRPEDLERVFGRFERATSIKHHGGLGLGLYVSRQIIAAHGGTVTARNRPEGGAQFTVRLPFPGKEEREPMGGER